MSVVAAGPGTADEWQPLDAQVPTATNLPTRNPGFVGRAGVLEEIRARLADCGRVVTRPEKGLPGVGKTQLAIEYAHRFVADYDVVWLIAAEQPDLIGGHLAQLAVEAGLVSGEVTIQAAVQALFGAMRTSVRWLLIFDNVEEPDAVIGWLPPHGGHVVITSRRRNWDEIAAPVDVAMFNRTESITLLQGRVPGITADDADRLADTLGDWPLALAQAAATLNAELGMSVEEYLHELTSHAGQLLGEGPRTYPRSLAAAVRLGFDRLGLDNPAGAQLLKLCIVLAPEPIPVWVFADQRSITALPEPLAAHADSVMVLRRLVQGVIRHGLASEAQQGIQVHRLVQAVITEQLNPDEVVALRECAAKIVAASAPTETDDPATWPVWSTLAPHVIKLDAGATAVPEFRDVACRSVLYLLRRGETQAAVHLVSHLRQSWQDRLGPDDPHTLKATTEYAHARYALGHILEAQSLIRDTLARYQRVLGDDHPDTLRSAQDLAVTLNGVGDYAVALALGRQTWERRRRVLGEEHPDTLSSASGVAAGLHAMGDYAESLALSQQTWERRRRVLGEEHPDTLSSAQSVAVGLDAVGGYARALALDRETWERRRRVLGEEHPDTLSSARSVAVGLHAVGDYAGALALDRETWERRRRILGEEHPVTLSSAHGVAVSLHGVGDYVESLALVRQTWEQRRRILGEEHPDTVSSAQCVAAGLHAMGSYAESLALVRQTWEQRHRVLGEDHPLTQQSAGDMAIVLTSLKRWGDARLWIKDVPSRLRASLGPDHPDVARYSAVRAQIARAMGGSGSEAKLKKKKKRAGR